MALKKVKGNLGRMFDKNLTDLVRGIRNNKDNESKYITQCMEEIKGELRQDNLSVKANAVAKLTYLQMLGYDIEWAGFNIIEVMSSLKFTYKRIGYLAASQCFNQETEVLMLTTNMIRKDLNSQNMYDSGTALTGLACFINTDLARDLANDVMTLLSSTKPYIRKKAVLLMYKIFLKFPEALRPAFPRLKEKLEDPDPGVQSAAVNVICELARKNPKNYLSLAPVFFKLMTSSTNNWMLIKIIKLFGALTPLEPRLGKKLIEPLTNLIHSTSAMSLLYECINTVIAVLLSISEGMPKQNSSIQLCVMKLRILIEDSDQNLKYLGLLAMSKILHTHPKSVQTHKDLILQCLDDKDESIRLRALDLLYGMVSRKNVMEIIRKLMTHMDRAEGSNYRDELLQKIIMICSQNNYQLITNFEWYISVLVELCRMEGSQHGNLISSQMLDVAIRVPAVREFTVGQMALLLENSHMVAGPSITNSSLAEVLYAAAWICGEFSQLLSNPLMSLESLLNKKVLSLPGHIQSVFIQNSFKIYSRIIVTAEEENDKETVEEVTNMILDRLPLFSSSGDIEVQERSTCILQIVKATKKVMLEEDKLGSDLQILSQGDMNPVAAKAQRKVPVPEGLDLDAWINEPDVTLEVETDILSLNDLTKKNLFTGESIEEPEYLQTSRDLAEDEIQRLRDARKLEQINNPYYVKSSPGTQSPNIKNSQSIENIPVAPITLNKPLIIPGMTSLDKYQINDTRKQKHPKSKRKIKKNAIVYSSSEDETAIQQTVNTDMGEMPEGAAPSDDEDADQRPLDDPHRALNINLDLPLSPEEVIPTRHHRVTVANQSARTLLQSDSIEKPRKHKTKTSSSKESRKKSTKKPSEEVDLLQGLYDNQVITTNDIDGHTGHSAPPKKAKKKEKKSKKGRKGDTVGIDVYEEIVPSYENLNSNSSKMKTLVKDSSLKVKYHLTPDLNQQEMVLQWTASNISKSVITHISLSFPQTNEVEITSKSEVSFLASPLKPKASSSQSVRFRVASDCKSVKCNGLFSYKNSDSNSMSFSLNLTTSSFLSGQTTSQSRFRDLLAGGQLQNRSSFNIPDFKKSFADVLQKFAINFNLNIVEQEGHTASLHAQSVHGNNICLLVKLTDQQKLNVNGKCENRDLLTNLMDQLEQSLQ